MFAILNPTGECLIENYLLLTLKLSYFVYTEFVKTLLRNSFYACKILLTQGHRLDILVENTSFSDCGISSTRNLRVIVIADIMFYDKS